MYKRFDQIIQYKPLSIIPKLDGVDLKHDFNYKFPDEKAIIGIEIEAENVIDWKEPLCMWYTKEDGSLRNHGMEFISYPLPSNKIEVSLTHLFSYVLFPKTEFSHRTSVHIHMNIRDMTEDEMTGMVATYITVEKLLFNFDKVNRYKNIFCVPLGESSLLDVLKSYSLSWRRSELWMKYTAMNLCPIASLGTVEFRHLAGTRDILHIMQWISLLMRLKMFAQQHASIYIIDRIKELNTNSQYREFVMDVFGDQFGLLNSFHIKENMELNVTKVKYSFLDNSYFYEVYPGNSEKSPLKRKYNLLQKVKKKKEASFPEILIDDLPQDVRVGPDRIFLRNPAEIEEEFLEPPPQGGVTLHDIVRNLRVIHPDWNENDIVREANRMFGFRIR